MNAALVFSDNAYHTSSAQLMGAQSASEAFLRAFLRYGQPDKLHCVAAQQGHYRTFVDRVQALGVAPAPPCVWISPLDLPALGEVGTVYHPDPTIIDTAWRRARGDSRSFSITGVTHTTCSDNFMDLAGQFSLAPLQTWDALICTSHSVLDTVTHVLDAWENHLRERLGATRFPRPMLPVIPLGVDVEHIPTGGAAQALRRVQRAAQGIGGDEIAFLFFGRLSFHAKAHPLPMFLALERAARATGKKLHLILAGWFANTAIESTFVQGAQKFCPSIRLKIVDGRRPEIRQQIWFAADVFTSLSDNIQETFGLTPLEALAAGLPVVVSDWNGYRDTVRHGQDGFLVPTAMPPPGAGDDIAERFAARIDHYDRYIAHVGQCTAVDVAACARYYQLLIEQPELRQQLGSAGRRRVEEAFSWRGVIARYHALWAELAQLRRAAAQEARPANRPWHPLREDPLRVFSRYATHVLTDDLVLAASGAGDALAYVRGMYSDPLANFAGAPFVLGTREEAAALVAALAAREQSVADLCAQADIARRSTILRTLGWLLKIGAARIVTPASEPPSHFSPR